MDSGSVKAKNSVFTTLVCLISKRDIWELLTIVKWVLCPQVEIHDVNEAMRLIESSKDSLLKQQTNKGYTQNTVDRVYAAIRAMAEGSKTLKIQEIRDRLVPLNSAVKVKNIISQGSVLWNRNRRTSGTGTVTC